MLLKSQKSKQRIVEVKKLFSNLINIAVSPATLRGNFNFQKTFVFSQKNSQLNIRGMSGFMCFRWLPIREKNLFFAILPFWRLFIGFYLRA